MHGKAPCPLSCRRITPCTPFHCPAAGAGYYKPITQFSKGEYTNANELQVLAQQAQRSVTWR
jgi:hypothetical protein